MIAAALRLTLRILHATARTLFSGTAHIAFPGVLPVSVTNGDGQVSNALDFTVT